MSKSNFSTLAKEHPELSGALEAINDWLTRKLGVGRRYITTDLYRISRSSRIVPDDLSNSRSEPFGEFGHRKKEYRFQTRSGAVLGEAKSSPRDFKGDIFDEMSNETYTIDEGDIVPFYTFKK
jgi:hypothetical protein